MSALAVCGVLAWAAPDAAAQQRGRNQSGGAQIPQIKVEAQLMWYELDGDFGVSSGGGGPVPNVDLDGDTDLDDEILAAGLRVSLGDIRMGWLEFGWQRFASTGKRFLHHGFSMNNVNFPAGSLVRTRLDFRWAELVLGQLYGYGGGYYIGYEVGGADYRYRLRVRDPINLVGSVIDKTPSMPLVGIKLGIGMGEALLIMGTVRGNFFNFGSLNSNVLEATVEVRWMMTNAFLLHTGWQYFRLDATFNMGVETGKTDFFVNGPFLGLEIRIG